MVIVSHFVEVGDKDVHKITITRKGSAAGVYAAAECRDPRNERTFVLS